MSARSRSTPDAPSAATSTTSGRRWPNIRWTRSSSCCAPSTGCRCSPTPQRTSTSNAADDTTDADHANAAYLAANQEAVADYTYFDTWYLHRDDPELAGPYLAAFSPALRAAVERNVDDPFDDAYYEEMYAYPNELFDEADTSFGVAQDHDERGDRLQLVVMMTAVGLAFAAWASLLGRDSAMRLLFAALAIVALALGLASYFTIPPVSG